MIGSFTVSLADRPVSPVVQCFLMEGTSQVFAEFRLDAYVARDGRPWGVRYRRVRA